MRIDEFVFTEHALIGMKRRGLSEELIERVVLHPDQGYEVRPGRWVFQSKVEERGRNFLVRVFVDIDRKPAEIVTAYKTSKISKYWRKTS